MKRPTEFLPISECVNRLVQGMWGNAPRAEPLREIKQVERDLSVGFGPRREDAATLLRAAALQGTLPTYVRPRSTTVADAQSPVEAQQVSPELLKRIVPIQEGLPDHPTHIRRKPAADGPDVVALLLLLRHGELVVRQSDFSDWYKRQRAKGSWSSQHNKKVSRRGRPTKDSESLRNAILGLVRDGAWRAVDGMPKLRRLLMEKGYESPSSDTLARGVDRLHRLTGEPELRRRVRRRPASRKNQTLFRSRNLN
jgi:hypothetical protein